MNNKGAPLLRELTLTKANNFDFLRFFVAIFIVVSHSYALSDGYHDNDLIFILTKGQETFGKLALKAFYVISGFLITQSYERTNDVLKFFKARILRILPGVVFIVFISTLVLGPIITEHSPNQYFSNPLTYKYLLSVFLIDVQYNLPGVFENNIYPGAVNGSLWTLKYVFGCYIVLAFLGITQLLKKRVVLLILGSAYFLHLLNIESSTLSDSVYFLTYFMVGAAIYFFRDNIRISSGYAGICAALLCISSVFGVLKAALPILWAYIIIYFAFHPKIKLHSFGRNGDYSYGMFVVGFPIQQLVVQYYGGSMNAYVNFVISFPIILVCAFFSWHIIEKPCLKLKKYKLTDLISKGATRVQTNN